MLVSAAIICRTSDPPAFARSEPYPSFAARFSPFSSAKPCSADKSSDGGNPSRALIQSLAMHRRDLFRASAALPALSYSRVLGANDRVNLGLIGCGGRGRGVMGTFQKTNQVQVTAVCDVFSEQIGRASCRERV